MAAILASDDLVAPSPAALMRRRALSHLGLMAGAAVLLFVLFLALAAPLIAPHDPYAQDLSRRLMKA